MGLPLFKTLDWCAPYLALGQSIGRVGCFFNGCCYGKAVSWGIYFPAHDARLHPTQLYSAVGLFILYLILKNYRNKKHSDGAVFVTYLFYASAFRFIIEFLRADHVAYFGPFSIFQIICLALMIAAIYVNIILKSRGKR